jgi:hypothetical protein
MVDADPWQFFSADEIADMANSPVDSVRDNWPRLVGQLDLCGINDRATQVAMFGTVAIEAVHTFEPVREAFFLGEPEPAESHRQTLSYYPYYGRGFIQCTLRGNYAAYGPKIRALWGAGDGDSTFDLIAHPDNMLDADMSAAFAALYFRDHGGDGLALIPEASRRGDWTEVRRLVQGGADGLPELEAIAAQADTVPA